MKDIYSFIKSCMEISPKTSKSFDPITHEIIDLMLKQNGFDINIKTFENCFQKLKSISNKIGKFHEDVLVLSNPPWHYSSKSSQWDIENDQYAIEIKNKYNTVKGSDKSKIYMVGKEALAQKFDTFFMLLYGQKSENQLTSLLLHQITYAIKGKRQMII